MMLTVQILKLRFKDLHISKRQVSICKYENEMSKAGNYDLVVPGYLSG